MNLVSFGSDYSFSASGFPLCGWHHITWYLLVRSAILLSDSKKNLAYYIFFIFFIGFSKILVMAPVSSPCLLLGATPALASPPVFALHYVLSSFIITDSRFVILLYIVLYNMLAGLLSPFALKAEG